MTGKILVAAKYRSSSARASPNSRRTRPSANGRGTRGVYSASISPETSMPVSVRSGGIGAMSISGGTSWATFATRPGWCWPPVRYRTDSTGTP